MSLLNTLNLYTLLSLLYYMTLPKKKSPYQRVSPENMADIENGIGKFGESFDDVLKRLITYWKTGEKEN